MKNPPRQIFVMSEFSVHRIQILPFGLDPNDPKFSEDKYIDKELHTLLHN